MRSTAQWIDPDRDTPMPIDHWFYADGLPQNYKPNANLWQVGDYVLHDADAKREDMLMRVIGYVGVLVQTEYVDPEKRQRWGSGKKSRLINRVAVLHDPRRFGVKIPERDGSAHA